MAKNRKAATKKLLEMVSAVETLVNSRLPTTKLYQKILPTLSDVELDAFMERLRNREEYVTLIIPNYEELQYDDEGMKDFLQDTLGVPIEERVWWVDDETGEEILTPESYPVLKQAQRRQSQHLLKKQSLAKDTATIDQATGQVTGQSKGGRLSLAEIRLMQAKSLDNSILEAIKVRGGDDEAMEKFLQDIRDTGNTSVKEIEKLGSKPRVIKTLRAWLLAASYDNTLPKGNE